MVDTPREDPPNRSRSATAWDLMRMQEQVVKAINGLRDEVKDSYVLREADKGRHDKLNADLRRIERKVDGSLVAVFLGTCTALWAFLRTKFGV